MEQQSPTISWPGPPSKFPNAFLVLTAPAEATSKTTRSHPLEKGASFFPRGGSKCPLMSIVATPPPALAEVLVAKSALSGTSKSSPLGSRAPRPYARRPDASEARTKTPQAAAGATAAVVDGMASLWVPVSSVRKPGGGPETLLFLGVVQIECLRWVDGCRGWVHTYGLTSC